MPNCMTDNAAVPPMPNDRETLEGLRRKVGFCAWQRGTSEANLLIGTFADQSLTWFDAEELCICWKKTTRSSTTGLLAGGLFPRSTTTGS
jgi:hypothetical protein